MKKADNKRNGNDYYFLLNIFAREADRHQYIITKLSLCCFSSNFVTTE